MSDDELPHNVVQLRPVVSPALPADAQQLPLDPAGAALRQAVDDVLAQRERAEVQANCLLRDLMQIAGALLCTPSQSGVMEAIADLKLELEHWRDVAAREEYRADCALEELRDKDDLIGALEHRLDELEREAELVDEHY